ncbi:MAG: hypothetical protein V4739_12040 [Pseudomonadota bacterium]
MKSAKTQPAQVPTLTEVVDMDAALALRASPALELVTHPAGGRDEGRVERSSALVGCLSLEAQAALTQQVLRSVQAQVDSVLNERLKDILVPILAQCAETMMAALRVELASTLHEVVAQAVALQADRRDAA